jgi:hypothetical protein
VVDKLGHTISYYTDPWAHQKLTPGGQLSLPQEKEVPKKTKGDRGTPRAPPTGFFEWPGAKGEPRETHQTKQQLSPRVLAWPELLNTAVLRAPTPTPLHTSHFPFSHSPVLPFTSTSPPSPPACCWCLFPLQSVSISITTPEGLTWCHYLFSF